MAFVRTNGGKHAGTDEAEGAKPKAKPNGRPGRARRPKAAKAAGKAKPQK